ncbi:MAG: PD40 domain-containing protein [Bacteroidales bacterium]|nr:PD40 domain-containing protein [Bacteroidales bacterium]
MKKTTLYLAILLAPLFTMAQEVINIIHLDNSLNTIGNESAPMLLDPHTLYYSYLPHSDTAGRKLELDAALMQIMQATVDDNGVASQSQPVKDKLNSNKEHSGNTAYDSRNGLLYFTRCETSTEGRTPCAIYTARRRGDRWREIKKMNSSINLEGYTATQPSIAYLDDGSTLVYFSSNRPGGLGGMDLWYTIVRDGKASEPINLGQPINSGYDEITPFYDNNRQVLYFSSDRAGGRGGFDIYASNGSRNTYCKPVAMPAPINSTHNDIFYTISDSNATRGYFSSNREGSLYASTQNCCNDLYLWRIETIKEEPEPAEPDDKPAIADNPPATPPTTPPSTHDQPVAVPVEPSPHNPITLYFHNDEPDPGSIATTTKTRYDQLSSHYIAMLPIYKEAWAKHYNGTVLKEAEEDLDHFFKQEVKGNNDRLEKFMWMVAEQLWNGRNVTITVKGYASPLHNSEYNAYLSQRRINSFLNYLRYWNQGNLRRCIADGTLRIIQVPYGSSTANKNVSANQNDQVHSVYSVEAARERRIEIIDYATE